MKIEILDVGHGQCIYVLADNGNVMLFDCGSDEYLQPSSYLPRVGCRGIERFFVTNYDEDHISDLPRLRRLPIQILHRNITLTAEQLRALKRSSGPITTAMESLLQMMSCYTSKVVTPPEFPGFSFTCYSNRYGQDFTDTNNLSLVTFLHYRSVHLVIPGDLEAAGWRKLIEQPAFRAELRTVNLFVASHHGRESGYCEEVFEYCSPELVLVSDEEMQYATQEMTSVYASHASGVRWPNQVRYVLTTRSDGKITISQGPADANCVVSYAPTERGPQ